MLDGEIVCVDKRGKPQFRDLLFRRGDPCFFAFDLLAVDGKDCRTSGSPTVSRNFDGRYGGWLQIPGCNMLTILMGLGRRYSGGYASWIVAKHKYAPYVADLESSTWFKIRNRTYSQTAGREELFERERHREPCAGMAFVCVGVLRSWGGGCLKRLVDFIAAPPTILISQ